MRALVGYRPTLCVALAAAVALFGETNAAYAAATPAIATVTTVRPLSLVKTDDLEFGTLIASSVAGTATINPNTDARTTAGGVIGAPGATPSAAHFTAAGLVNSIALITLPASVTLTRVSGTETMAVTAITSNGALVRVLPNPATIDIAVGGTLAVGVNQVPGSYTGSFNITVLYF